MNAVNSVGRLWLPAAPAAIVVPTTPPRGAAAREPAGAQAPELEWLARQTREAAEVNFGSFGYLRELTRELQEGRLSAGSASGRSSQNLGNVRLRA